MPIQAFAVSKVTLAVTNMNEMVEFYNKVLGAGLNEFEAMGAMLYSGNFAGINIILCPNSIACVEAVQSRHQFDILVDNLDKLMINSLLNHGVQQGEITENRNEKSVTLIDPDGNTMNFIQKL